MQNNLCISGKSCSQCIIGADTVLSACADIRHDVQIILRTVYGNDTIFVCGYEAGCLGYTLYHQLTDHHVDCVILAPTTMLEQRGKKRIKTDKRDAEIIGRCLQQQFNKFVVISGNLCLTGGHYISTNDKRIFF